MSASSSSDRNNSQARKDYESMSVKNLRNLLTLRGYDCSQCLEKSELVAVAQRMDNTDYDEEAHKIFRELHLEASDGAMKSRYSNLDAIWKHPTGGGIVYVGNHLAASDLRTLQERNIFGIVNCQDVTSKNYFEGIEPDIHYYRFVVSKLAVSRDLSTLPFHNGFEQCFSFIESNIAEGKSVLIHCLAGAHRAGTVGVAWLMFKTGKGVDEALQLAKACRPIISPFGTLMGLLSCLQFELQSKNDNNQS